MAVRVKEMDPDLAVELGVNLGYMQVEGRAAVLPEVRHRIGGSRFFPDCSEVRTSLDPDNEDAPHVRTLAYFAPDGERIFLAVCGDKSGSWTEWYERAIPIADDLYQRWLDEQGLVHEGGPQ